MTNGLKWHATHRARARVLLMLWMASLTAWSATTAEAADAQDPSTTLVIATYDSFVAKGGLGPEIFPLFEKKCGCKVKAIAAGDGAQLLSKLQLDAERGKPRAHVVLGLDQSLWERAKPYLDVWGKWQPRGYASIPKDLRVGQGFLPFDYGVMAFMADTARLSELKLQAPRKLTDLLKPEWRRQVILQDPRTSTPGLGFLLYADIVGGEGFWSKFRSRWLTLAPGWDGAYGLFLKKEAPLVWSYTSSQAYHREHGDLDGRYQALVFEEGNPAQIEGAAIVHGAFNVEAPQLSPKVAGIDRLTDAQRLRKIAQDFLEFLLSPEVQTQVPSKNWMLPVMPGIVLPESFKTIPKPVKIVATPTDASAIEKALADWKRAIGTGARK